MSKLFTQMEQEADVFAVCLLIPGNMLKEELDKKPLDLVDDTRFKELCKLFDVSYTTMMFRLSILKYYP